ncbi:MAG: sulfite exporter TauE/SafE family protein [Chloroflexi bacterium]|nr:sulfite exporter TauE/SafE family protein [Ardenticatenaceae bacterium]MBL1129583.1 sulfite exporter TauE/SafE family protein [Chloroflexota bacterium]NOG35664.1 sulfite exporter TauE/SafE family protein [Chloroflexota bacterium]GIK56987.1 MAG: UPF0721 transmembrane protein [Chloroflexota bacterium]
MTENSNPSSRRPRLAFGLAIPIGVMGGLIGLGGAEFRLPVLAGSLGYSARQAVPLNLAVSLITVITSLLIRGWTLSYEPLSPYLPAIFALIAGAVVMAYVGATLARRISAAQLERAILVLLLLIGVALIIEGFLPQTLPALLPDTPVWHIAAGLLFGIAIGLVSSLLGVAGGEIIIPTLIFAYGVDVKTAGTASLLISLPTILVGLLRYQRQGALSDRQALKETVAPMGVGSVIGAIVGGLLVGIVPASWLKVGLGVILIISAYRTFGHTKHKNETRS